jgi:putative membrane protein
MRKWSFAFSGASAPALLAALSLPALAQSTVEPERYYYMPHMGWEAGWSGFSWIAMILVIGLAIAIIALLVRSTSGPSQRSTAPTNSSRALDILKERFARGEIDKAEFEDKRRALSD